MADKKPTTETATPTVRIYTVKEIIDSKEPNKIKVPSLNLEQRMALGEELSKMTDEEFEKLPPGGRRKNYFVNFRAGIYDNIKSGPRKTKNTTVTVIPPSVSSILINTSDDELKKELELLSPERIDTLIDLLQASKKAAKKRHDDEKTATIESAFAGLSKEAKDRLIAKLQAED